MDLYTKTSYQLSKVLTNAYSTSFSMSMQLFDASIREHIYAIYGAVRIADEIVDTYEGSDQLERLDELEKEINEAIKRGYSANPIVHSFAITAKQYDILDEHIVAFFESMRMDLSKITYDQATYEKYIYGSAEVVGLMCLKVFTNDETLYMRLERGASKLGAAYQKVNFLRDIYADAVTLNRWYFPISSYEQFDEKTKQSIVKDIETDFKAARHAAVQLPLSSRRAVMLSITYYEALLDKLHETSAKELKVKRIRINNAKKLALLAKAKFERHDA